MSEKIQEVPGADAKFPGQFRLAEKVSEIKAGISAASVLTLMDVACTNRPEQQALHKGEKHEH